MSDGLEFCYTAVFQVYVDEDGKIKDECLEDDSTCAALQYPFNEDHDIVYRLIEKPKAPGVYRAWVVGTVEFYAYHGYEGTEYDQDYHFDVCKVRPAKVGDIEVVWPDHPCLHGPTQPEPLEIVLFGEKKPECN